jgi:5'-3' exonuclease
MSIEQTVRGDETIICTRDKDLRSVDGWHYGWELGEQPSFGPFRVDGYGAIFLSDDRKKVTGYGLKFFLSQCLTGDRVDSIPGLPKCGPVAAFDILANTNTYAEGLEAVVEAYSRRYAECAYMDLEEQGRLLWMTRKLNEDGSPVLWDVKEIYK